MGEGGKNRRVLSDVWSLNGRLRLADGRERDCRV